MSQGSAAVTDVLLDHRGYEIGLWQNVLVKADPEHPAFYGDKEITSVIPPGERAECLWCRRLMFSYRHPRGVRWFRHAAGQACTAPPQWTEPRGETLRHQYAKHYIADVYNATHRWHASVENDDRYIISGDTRRKPDVGAEPVGSRKKEASIHRVTTALEVQTSHITELAARERITAHRKLGVRATIHLTTWHAAWQGAADVHLRDDASVFGVASVCAVDPWDRDYESPADIDKFLHLLTRGHVLMTDEYGAVTRDAWLSYKNTGQDLTEQRRTTQQKRSGRIIHRSCDAPASLITPAVDMAPEPPTVLAALELAQVPPPLRNTWRSYAPRLNCPHPASRYDREFGVILCEQCGGCLGQDYDVRAATAALLERTRRAREEEG